LCGWSIICGCYQLHMSYETITQVCNMAHPPRRSFRKKRERTFAEAAPKSQTKAAYDATNNVERHKDMFARLTDIKRLDPSCQVAPIALRCRRIQLGLGCEELGRMIGMSAGYIESIEVGNRVALHNIWERIASSITI